MLYLIKLYQTYISPRKGYCCAYGALYKNGSCSVRVSDIIQSDGLISGGPKIKNQFVLCTEAYEAIKDNNKVRKERKKKDKYEWCDFSNACEIVNCIPTPGKWCRGNPADAGCDLPCDCSL